MTGSEEELKSFLMKVKEEWKCSIKTQHSKTEDHGIWFHHFMVNRWCESGHRVRFNFLGFQNHHGWWLQLQNEKRLASWRKSYYKPRQCTKKQKYHFVNTGKQSQSYGFFSSHVWMWELDCKEGWAPKNWCFQTAVLEKTLETPLDSKEITPVNPKGNQLWILTGRPDSKAEVTVLWPPDAKNQLTGKDPDAEKDWGQEETGAAQDEMVGWHHWLNGHELEQTLGDSGQGSLACYSSWGHKESVLTWGLTMHFLPLYL